ncbi:MAG: hypothetical protein K2X27_18945, partial [Candidatus Obscuribacterales bacterium]|nr:hypothetical protein [Candidatus Obscuribacterales bacterium]
MAEGTTRRSFLAAIPLAATFGLLISPFMRYLRPTIKPLDILGPSDQPKALEDVSFKQGDFAEPWTCLQFMFSQTYKEYNPEGMEVRKIP